MLLSYGIQSAVSNNWSTLHGEDFTIHALVTTQPIME